MSYWYVLLSATFLLAAEIQYTVNYERLVLSYYDKSLVRDAHFLFRKYNRTNFCLNTSFVLLEDLDGNKIQCTNSVHQKINNEYKPTGMEITFTVCKLWEKDVYGTMSYMRQFGNLTACDIKKGFYYMYNFMPDVSLLPKYVPLGSYMIEMDVVRNRGDPLLKFQWYVSAAFKTFKSKFRG